MGATNSCKGVYLISHRCPGVGLGGRGQHCVANKEAREPEQVQLTRLWSTGQLKTKLTVMLTMVQCSDF